jgi:hypothetical protein
VEVTDMTATILHINFAARRLEKVETPEGTFTRIEAPESASEPSPADPPPISDVLAVLLDEHVPGAKPAVTRYVCENHAFDPGPVPEPKPTPSFTPAYCDPANEVRGAKYDETKRLDIAEIAKLVRADIKAAKKEGKLPKKGFKTSVRIERFSGGCSLNISVKTSPFQVLNPEYLTWEAENPHECKPYWLDRYTPEAKAALELLKGIMGSYNRDNSDTMSDYFDVRFYGDAGFDWELERAERDAHKASN